MTKYRIEHDLLGEMKIPDNVYYGVHTQRAINNFPISAQKISDNIIFVKALAQTKKACALANRELGTIPKDKADIIIRACDEIIVKNRCIDQFQTDIYQ